MKIKDNLMKEELLLYIGTYTLPILFGTGEIVAGKGKGIHAIKLDYKKQTLRPAFIHEGVDNPSWLSVGKTRPVLYAVNELKEYAGASGGAVSAFAIDPETGSLEFLNQKATGGQDPCHLVSDAAGRFLYAANFMTGSICAYELLADGRLGERTDFIQHQGSSVHPARQKGPHAHACIIDKTQKRLLVPDLGMDRVMAYDITAEGKLLLSAGSSYICEPGNGPRYGEFHSFLDRFYLINELGSSVTVLAGHEGSARRSFEHLQTVSTIPAPQENTCADLHITPDGRYLFASNRGHDSIAMFRIGLVDGKLTLVDILPCGGKTPRNFAIDPKGEYLIVANQDSDNVALFAFDETRERLEQVYTLSVPTPVCICPYISGIR